MYLFISSVGLSYKREEGGQNCSLEEPLLNSGSTSIMGENKLTYENASFFKLHGG